MDEGGIGFIAHHKRFSHDTPDEIWLAAAADKSWRVVTRDQRIRYRANELAAMQRARLHVFDFTQGGLTAAATGSILVRCHAAMLRQATQVTAVGVLRADTQRRGQAAEGRGLRGERSARLAGAAGSSEV